jgi:hypothetical protein
MKKYLFNIAISLDQLCNTILFGNPDETMSSRMGKHLAKHENCPVCTFLCKLLNYIQKDHCTKAIETDRGESM